MKTFIIFLAILSSLLFSTSSMASQCEGPADLCNQIQQLEQKLESQKTINKSNIDSTVTTAKTETGNKTTKMIGIAAIVAVVLKILISILKGWTDFFKNDKGKAILRLSTVVLGFAAFIFTNLGFGMPFWEAMILAGGPPGAILVHELSDIIPLFRGKPPTPSPEPKEDLPALAG